MSTKSTLAAFVGTTPNIGTTLAAFAAAYRLAESYQGRVGYLCLNLKSAKIHRYLGIDGPVVALDDLRPELRSLSLTPGKLTQSMLQVRGAPLYVLFGNTMRDQAEFYRPEEIDHLLEIAHSAFDVVIADVGAYWDNAATVCTLRCARTRVLATTPALSHFQEDGQRWVKQLSPLFGIPGDGYEALVIRLPGMSGGYQSKDICKEMGVSLMGELKANPSLMGALDSGKIDEWLAHDEEGRLAMAAEAASLAARHGLKRRPVMTVQPWYKRLVAHRSGKSLS
ncbi:hypothetical protein ACFFSY_22845 [Paenibacillus aurantiacus]|uniref:ParA family protein n=1 Tax=Paenibacillus aurantiacus TaxID=1936118 RepID=A0ABV5KU75_9BACL